MCTECHTPAIVEGGVRVSGVWRDRKGEEGREERTHQGVTGRAGVGGEQGYEMEGSGDVG